MIPALIGLEPLQLMSLSAVQGEKVSPTSQQQQQFLLDHLHHTSSLLLWLGQRFGRVSSRGVSLSFDGMNLTHRHLADIAGTTGETFTKALTRFRQEGALVKEGCDELLRPDCFTGVACGKERRAVFGTTHYAALSPESE